MKKKGFTLIELLVVIAIIGILASIILVSLGAAKSKSRDAKRVSDIRNIQLALSLYYNDNLFYPKNIYYPSNKVAGSDPSNGLAPAYISIVPADPNSAGASGASGCVQGSGTGGASGDGAGGGCYRYDGLTTGGVICNYANAPGAYHLGATLENSSADGLGLFAQDSDIISDPTLNGTPFTSCTGAGQNSGFNGRSVTFTSALMCNDNANLAVGATENCYDVSP